MKIAVACTHPSPTSPVAMRFGRAPWFLVYDMASNHFVTLRHQTGETVSTGTGITAARMIRRSRVGAVVAGQFGDSATRILHGAHITLAAAGPITVAQAIADFKYGRLVDL